MLWQIVTGICTIQGGVAAGIAICQAMGRHSTPKSHSTSTQPNRILRQQEPIWPISRILGTIVVCFFCIFFVSVIADILITAIGQTIFLRVHTVAFGQRQG